MVRLPVPSLVKLVPPVKRAAAGEGVIQRGVVDSIEIGDKELDIRLTVVVPEAVSSNTTALPGAEAWV